MYYCFIVSKKIAGQLEYDIKETLVQAINWECKCGFQSYMIDHGEFNYHSDYRIGYR